MESPSKGITWSRSRPLLFSLGTTCCQVVVTWYIGNICTQGDRVTLGTSLQRRQSHWEHLYREGSHVATSLQWRQSHGNISTVKAVTLGTSLQRRQFTLGTSLQRVSNLVFYAQSTITVISGCSAKRRQSHWGHLYREGSHTEDICTEKAVTLRTSVQRRQSRWEHTYRLTEKALTLGTSAHSHMVLSLSGYLIYGLKHPHLG